MYYNIKNTENIMTLQLSEFNYFFFLNIDNNLLVFQFLKDYIKRFCFYSDLKNFTIEPNYNKEIVDSDKD